MSTARGRAAGGRRSQPGFPARGAGTARTGPGQGTLASRQKQGSAEGDCREAPEIGRVGIRAQL